MTGSEISNPFPSASDLPYNPHISNPFATEGPAPYTPQLRGGFTDNEMVYTSYSGTDIVAQIVLPGEPPLIFGELQTISYSIHRENTPVRFIGHVSPRGFLKGPRTIAGSLIFTNFNLYVFYRLEKFKTAINRSQQNVFPLADMLPPFDVVVSFSNESGSFSKMRIYGVTVVDEGGTMSIDDLITESTLTYMARGIQPMTHYLPTGGDGQSLFTETSSRNSIRFL